MVASPLFAPVDEHEIQRIAPSVVKQRKARDGQDRNTPEATGLGGCVNASENLTPGKRRRCQPILFGRDLDRRLSGEPSAVRRAMSEQTLRLADAQQPANADPQTRARVRSAINASFLYAFRVNMLIAAALAAGSAGSALAIKRRTR